MLDSFICVARQVAVIVSWLETHILVLGLCDDGKRCSEDQKPIVNFEVQVLKTGIKQEQKVTQACTNLSDNRTVRQCQMQIKATYLLI